MEGITRREALREIVRRRRGALASLEAKGYTGEGAASTELARRGHDGALDSLKAQGYTGEGGAASASTEFARRGGVACAAIYRKAGDCAFPGCTNAIWTGGHCEHHLDDASSSVRSSTSSKRKRVVLIGENVDGKKVKIETSLRDAKRNIHGDSWPIAPIPVHLNVEGCETRDGKCRRI